MDLEKLTEKIDQLLKENIELKEKVSEREREVAAERDKATQKDREIQALLSDVSTTAKSKSDLEQRLISKEKRLEELEMEFEQAKVNLEKKEKLLEARKLKLGIANYKCAKSNQQLEEYKKKFKKEEEEMKSIIKEKDEEIGSQRNEISILQMEIKNKLDETVQVHAELINQNTDIEKNLEKEKKTCQNLQTQLQKVMEESSKYESALRESEKKKEEMGEQLLEYEKRISILQETLRGKQLQCNAMQKFLEEDHTFILDQERNRISQEEARSQKFRNFLLTLNSENFVPVQDSVVECTINAPSRNTNYVGEEIERVEPSTSASSRPSSTNSTTQQSSTCNAEPSTPEAPPNREGSVFPHMDVEDSDEESYEKDQTQARAESPSHSTHTPFCDSDVSTNVVNGEQSNQEEETDDADAAEAQSFHASSSAFCNTKKASARSSQVHGVDNSKPGFCLCGVKPRDWSTLKRHIKYYKPQHTFSCRKTGCNMVFSGTGYLRRHMEKDHNLKYTKSGCSGCGETFKSFPELRAHQKSKNCWATMDAPKGVKPKCGKTFARKRRTRLSQQKRSRKQTKPTPGGGRRNSPKQCQTLPKLCEVTVTLTDILR